MDDMTRPDAASPAPSAPAVSDDAPAPGRRRRLQVLMPVVIVLALIGGGVAYWMQTRGVESTDDAMVDANTTQIAPRVAGQVTRLLFADNQHVQAGQPLVQIDPHDFQARLDQARAQAAAASAALLQARAQVSVQRAAVDQADAAVRVNEADLAQARQDYQRYQQLPRGAVTRQQVDAATATFHAAQARLDASRQSVAGAQAQVQVAEAQVEAAQAQVAQADAALRQAELQLSYCSIVAPVAGIVTHRTVTVGNYVNPGQAMFALVQDGRWITANFKETQLAEMHPGQSVDIEIDAIPGIVFHGKVDSFQAGTGSIFSVLPAENATGNYVKIVQRLPVKIVFDDPQVKDHALAPGMSVVPTVRIR